MPSRGGRPGEALVRWAFRTVGSGYGVLPSSTSVRSPLLSSDHQLPRPVRKATSPGSSHHRTLYSKGASSTSSLGKPSSVSSKMATIINRPVLPPSGYDATIKLSPDTSTRSGTRSLSRRLPPRAWDSHMHVVDCDRYPLAPGASYRPRKHTLKDAMNFEKSVGIANIVLVQPSIYGYDNSCLLEALAELGPQRARGVVVCDPNTTTRQQLVEWHRLGVRGIRLNYVSNGSSSSVAQMHRSLRRYADLIRALGWVLQVYLPMSLIDGLNQVAPTLGVKICVDHMGYPSLPEQPVADPYKIPGFGSLTKLLAQEDVFVKLSAPYRLSKLQSQADLDPMAKEIIRLHGTDRVVFATDWPHTRFEGLDIRPWVEKVLDWCGDDAHLRERLFVKNAEDLWNIHQ